MVNDQGMGMEQRLSSMFGGYEITAAFEVKWILNHHVNVLFPYL
jgi:hypothetical protein